MTTRLRVPVNTGNFFFEKGAFYPDNQGILVGDNPITRESYGTGAYAGLIIIGLSGQDGEKFKLEDMVSIVGDIRMEQAGDPGASFIAQKGLFKHKITGKRVEEDSVRIIILNLTGESDEEFKENILSLADELAERFNQEAVIVEFQRKGVTEEVTGIGWKK
jgi:hypothetical protein